MKAIHTYIIVILCLLLQAQPVRAQFDFDITSTEAWINNHKTVYKLMMYRNILEEVNRGLHDKSSDAISDYRQINSDCLDKYTRAFDIINALYSGAKTVVNIKNTYSNVKDKISGLSELNQRYIDKCLSKGDIVPEDSLVIRTYMTMVSSISGDASDIYKSVTDLILYATGTASCTTSDLMIVLDRLNGSMDHINEVLNRGYYTLWRYITARTTYWKAILWRSKNMKQICEEAHGRWHGTRESLKPYLLSGGHVVTLTERKYGTQ